MEFYVIATNIEYTVHFYSNCPQLALASWSVQLVITKMKQSLTIINTHFLFSIQTVSRPYWQLCQPNKPWSTLITKFLTTQAVSPIVTNSTYLTAWTEWAANKPKRLNSLSNLDTPKVNWKNVSTNRQCLICLLLLKAKRFSCTVTGKILPCKYNLTRKSSNLMYCITCKTCLKTICGPNQEHHNTEDLWALF